MSDRLPNAYPAFPNNFPQGFPSQQAQHRPPQQQQQPLGTQPALAGIRKPEDPRVWQQVQQRQQQQQQQQLQQQHSGGEQIHGNVMNVSQQQQQQILQLLRSQVAQGLITREQAQERLAMMQASVASSFQEQSITQQVQSGFPAGGLTGSPAQQQMATLAHRPQASTNNSINPLQRVIQAQDPLRAHQLNMLLAQGQQQQNGSSFASRVGQNLHPPGMGLPQGQGSLQQNFIQPSPSAPPVNPQSSSAPSASQAPPLGGQQRHGLPNNIADASLPQLTTFHNQLIRVVMEGEKSLSAASSSGGEGDAQRQAFRNKLDNQKQILLRIRELINAKSGRQSGDSVQPAVNGASWIGAGQRPTGLYPVAERPPQHNSPALHQAPVNQVPPQRSIPTPQQNFVPSATSQSNLTQMSPHVSANGLPFNGALTQMANALSQQSQQIAHPFPQQLIQLSKLSPLPEDRFKHLFAQFANVTGIRLSERDFIIENRQVSPWALHRAVLARNGFDSVTANDEWPVIGAALGFPPFSGGDGTQPARCGPVVAHQLQQLYSDSLRHFDHAYLNSVLSRIRSLGQVPSQPPQQQVQPYQPTEADYQSLLANIPSDSPIVSPQAMSILPRFSHTSGAELEAHHVPQHVIKFVEQHREHLQRTAQDQNGFRAGLTSTKNPQLDNRAQLNQASTIQGIARPPQQLLPNHQQLQQLQRQVAQGQGKPNTLQPTQLFNNGVGALVRPPTAQSMNASSVSSMGTQIVSASSNGGAQGQGGAMSAPMNPGSIISVNSGSILTQSAGAMQIRQPTQEELIYAKKWVEEQKRAAFSHKFDGVAGYPTVPDSDIKEYNRNLERLDLVLTSIERYISFAFAVLKKEDVVRRMFTMMASTKFQLEEIKKPNPCYVLELHTIRGMIQEADNMDKGLKVVLGIKPQPPSMMAPGPPQPSQQPPPMGTPTPFTQPAPPAAPLASATGHRPPPAAATTTTFQPGHRKKPSQVQVSGGAVSTPTPPPLPSASTPTPQGATPGITAASPQTPKSPKGKAPPKPKSQNRRKVSTKATSIEAPTPSSNAASTPTSSGSIDTKGGVKRAREDDVDGATPGVISAPSPKRVKTDWEGSPNEEVRKREEQAANVETDEQALAFFETVTKFIDENPESAEAASHALDEILRACPPAPDIGDATLASSFSFSELPPTTPPHPLGNDFGEFFDFSAFDDTPTPDLVAGSSTNPSPESASDQDHPHTGHAGSSPQIPNVKAEDACEDLLRPSAWKEISGGDVMFHQASGWKWEGSMETTDQAWAISTS
ncbi:hypothetical protein B0F90DRAFT_1740642 [Multifurca ochricompacta]|uniref:ARID domain-containing protein n=1 Tax=Multifurca ochricompacta TaxID=376703 RepID=A0AAD4M0V0_9AGAM|nr:hypothetical protein B0F90DRAFT_1740642 [Multifurca ochricompacta]